MFLVKLLFAITLFLTPSLQLPTESEEDGVVTVFTYSDTNCTTKANQWSFKNDASLCQNVDYAYAKGHCSNGQLTVLLYTDPDCSGESLSSSKYIILPEGNCGNDIFDIDKSSNYFCT